MADDQWLLKEDGYLNVDTCSTNIIYHPNLNVILVFTKSGIVKVLDVNSGVILQSSTLSVDTRKVKGKYLPEQDRILFWDEKNIGLRADYNGVLLLDTILQTPILQTDDFVKLELLLSEAILFLHSINNLEEHGLENTADVTNELTVKIAEAQKNTKKGIKAQKWNTICLDLPHSSLKMVANSMVFHLKRLDRHIPALAIASAINERLTELQIGARVLDSVTTGNAQRFHMFSEAVRRKTFEQWPHMDYKWALPDQMAQAGFYHQPSATGDDRAMCFTCNVCLVCWEKTDEPWSEHERHSPECPFVKGEYTQNVPLAITFATNPATITSGFSLMSNGDQGDVICTGNRNGDIIIWNVEKQLKIAFMFVISSCDIVSIQLKQSLKNINTTLTALCTYQAKPKVSKTGQYFAYDLSKNHKMIGTKIACGVFIEKLKINSKDDGEASSSMVTEMNNQNQALSIQHGVNISEKNNMMNNRELFLVIYEIIDSVEIKQNITNNQEAAGINTDKKESQKLNNNTSNNTKKSSLKSIVPEERFDDVYMKFLPPELDIPMYDSWKTNDADKIVFNCSDIDEDPCKLKHIFGEPLLALKKKNQYKVVKINENDSASTISNTNNETQSNLNCHVIQCITLSPIILNSYEISEIIPSCDKKFLLIVLRGTKSKLKTNELNEQSMDIDVDDDFENMCTDFQRVQMLLYAVLEDGLINITPESARVLDETDTPIEICMLPTSDNNGRKLGGQNTQDGVFVMACANGSLKMLALSSLDTISEAHIDGEKFVSVTYCKSLERLCGCTEKGSLHFYSFYDLDADSGDDHEDDNLCFIASDTSFPCVDHDITEIDGLSFKDIHKSHLDNVPSTSSFASQISSHTDLSSSSNVISPNLAFKKDLTFSDLKTLYSMTLFDEMLTPYTAEVPGCWSELVQAQKQRSDTHLTKTWRLHNDATTWDEHIIELTLPKTANLGHVDFKFSLYQPCPNPPTIQITLLKQNSNGLGYRMKAPNLNNKSAAAVDENLDFNLSTSDLKENPVLHEEYLQAHNAEILAGPFELSSCMDLCDQGGLVVLTSPKLFKAKGRNYLLHIKTMTDSSKDGQTKTRGCDWLHEISITVRGTKHLCKIINERPQRCAMLESNMLLENLLKLSSQTDIHNKQNLTLDILIWIISIRLARFRSPKIEIRKSQQRKATDSPKQKNTENISSTYDMNTHQVECIKVIEENLKDLIKSCIVFGNRTTAHKCVKLIMLTSEGVQNLPKDKQNLINFEKCLEEAILKCLPHIVMSKYAGALRWFMLLIAGISTSETQGAIAEKCVSLLLNIVTEINRRWNSYSSLLRTRFGLYGMPFEPELFDAELPLPTKLNSVPVTIASVIKSATSPQLQNQTLDLKHFCISEGTELRILPFQLRQKGIGNHLKGLLEVEPLHFTCYTASEATRLENMDSQSANQSGNIIEDIIFEIPFENNIETTQNGTSVGGVAGGGGGGGGGVKKSEEKANVDDDMMNNVKNILVDKIFYSAFKKHKMKVAKSEDIESVDISTINDNDSLYTDIKSFGNQFDIISENDSFIDENISSNSNSNKSQEFFNDNSIDDNSIIPWHKLLSLPQKQMIVIDRMHSGARRFVTLDFGSPILLTDLIIPACEDLVSLFIDIWCFEEETDSIRLVSAPDIGVKTLVLSDLQPPPICRFLKITVTGRYGMSATRCKIPIGSYFGHAIILENDDYADSESKISKPKSANIAAQLKVLNSLFEDVNCRYSLSSSKLLELLEPLIKSEISNIAHMQTYLNKNKDSDEISMDNTKLLGTYEECITFQLQLNIIRSVIDRLESATNVPKLINTFDTPPASLASVCLDKLRVLSECLIEVLLHFIIEYGLKNVVCLHSYFDANTCNVLFNTLIVSGDAHMQLATCSLLVRMCCFQPWWGDFLTNIFSNLYSSQNSKIFPQDRVFFLLTYLGRKSIAMGTCRSIVIDSILKTIAKILAPISPRYRSDNDTTDNPHNYSVSSSADLQLLSWLLLFLSVCIDDGIGKKNQGFSRWDFMSGEADMSKARTQLNNNSGKNFSRSFKKRFFQNKQYNSNNLAEKFYLMQAEALHVAHFTSQIEFALKQQENQLKKAVQNSVKKSAKGSSTHSSSSSSSNTTSSKCSSEVPNESENAFDKGLRSLKSTNTLVVIRGLVGLLLGMDFTCNMDLFLLTCKVIARLVSACQPSIQLSKIMTTCQLQHFIRIAVWKDQQHPWAVHAITCLLQDILEADKNYKQSNINFNMPTSNDPRINIIPTNDPDDYSATNVFSEQVISDNVHSSGNSLVSKDLSYADVVKFNQLPSLMECDDTEMEDFLEDILERGKNLIKKCNNSTNRSGLTLSYRSVSCAKDSRLEYGLESNIEVTLRRLTMLSSLNLFASLPQVPLNETMCTMIEFPAWPDDIVQAWTCSEYNQGMATNVMLMMVFDNIFADLHLQDSWLSLEQVLQLWLTLNGELSEKSASLSGFNPGETPKIPFGHNAVHGLLSALFWHPGIKLRTWCLGFQCLTLACNPHFSFELISGGGMEDFNENYSRRMGVFMVDNPNFEKMLVRFFSHSEMTTSNFDVNRCAGPTICKLVHELFIWLEIKSDVTDMCYVKKKLKEILLRVVLQMLQPIGAIANQQGPIDAQSQLIKELLTFQYEKTDLGVAMSIIESVSCLAYTNIANVEKIYCQSSSDTNGTNVFGSLFATVLGSESSRQSKCVSDQSLLVNLLKLSSILVQTALPRRNDEPMSTNDLNIDDNLSNESQTDEIKAEQQHNENRVKVPCVADTVLQHYPTMTRLFGSLSHCSSSSFAMLVASSMYSVHSGEANNTLSEPQTVADAVFQLLMLLSKKATLPLLVVKPLYYFLNSTYSLRYALPKLQLSEPFLWFILKVLETPATVTIFTEMGGISVLCQSLVRSNKTIINVQPNLVSMIMQHITKSPKPQNCLGSSASSSGVVTKKSSQSSSNGSDDLINFAPFCTITSANPTAQPADVLIQAPIASHRRARSPAWTYLFYPNESHVDLTITLPSAVLLKEIHLQPHLSTLATCPSAVSIEITRDINLGPVPICLPMSTVGMTFIRLKFAQPEIAISVVIRLYRPRDSSNIGLTQISILGTTTFAYPCNLQTAKTTTMNEFLNDDESIAKSSLGWLRILAQCFSVASYNADSDLSNSVIKAAADTNGFLEACCSLLNVAHSSPNFALQNLETVLLKLGLQSKELGLKLIDNLLRNSIPQTFKLCNEPVSNLLYDLCTTEDEYTVDRISAMIEWIKNLHSSCQRSKNLLYATNPYNGFVKCLASILWTAYSTNLVENLANMITKELFESVYQWTLILEHEEPLKLAMDAMLCSICCIKPEMFPLLLQKMGVLVPNLSTDVDASISDDRKDPDSMTDDVKQEESDTAEWYSHLVIEDLSRLLLKPSDLHTIALACQSPLAIQQLLDSGLPRLLISAILEFCHRTSQSEGLVYNLINDQMDNLYKTCKTDSDKAEENRAGEHPLYPLVNVQTIAQILEFFSEICSEGHMRDWLGSYEGSVFWKPLLDILCNHTPLGFYEGINYTYLEEAMIKFLSTVSSCHPKNQEVLTINLISVIRKPGNVMKNSISGFTRRLVLQLLLESEKLLISVRSYLPLQRKEHTIPIINNHPSKRPNAHHLLFYLRTHTKCRDILENYVSIYNNILPTLSADSRAQDLINENSQVPRDSRKELLEMGVGMGLGMEFLSVAAGVTAKDKRLKEVKNQAAALKAKDLLSKFKMKLDESLSISNITERSKFIAPSYPGVQITGDTTLAQILSMLEAAGVSLSTPCLTLNLVQERKQSDEMFEETPHIKASDFEPLPSPLQIFSSRGGLSLLAHYLPTVYPENSKTSGLGSDKDKIPPVSEWVKVEPNDDIYEDVDDTLTETSGKMSNISSVPQHSLAAFGLFLRLPAYSDVLLRDKIKAQCLLRLVLGVTGDGEGNEIYSLSLASSLPTLPFEVFRQLLDSSPLTTDDGVLLRRNVIEVGAIHLVLNCLGIFTHHSQNYQFTSPQTEIPSAPIKPNSGEEQVISDDRSHVYWAKGTGFGTGSTQQSWNVEQALLRQKSEEEHVTVLLEVISSYINPGDKVLSNMNTEELIYREIYDFSLELPPIFLDLLQQSCLIPALSSYLRNDSVLDITRHIPLYRAILKVLRAIALSNQLLTLLMPQKREEATTSIVALLANMKTCVDTYASRLKVNKKSTIKGQTQKVTISLDDGDDEGLALLIPDIQETTLIVQNTINIDSILLNDEEDEMNIERPLSSSLEQRYLEVMKRLQFDTFEMIVETDNGYRFVVSHHFENNVRMAGDRGHPARVKRLAQETVTLSTSLPLSYSSSVFVRCDNDRLDIMKVLITGPADTPYANGCFEFDVYFPPDYPNSPMMINLETTGRHTVRFNPNLYNDGKVCLSVLNTWHGRPEEKWNAQTSSFLQVLVSIQSLILVPEPYFNEPGFERSRGTPSGSHSSREYNSNIYQASVRWAMLEQIKNPNPCFKDVIHTHFWLKRHEVCNQIENWITELSKPQYSERSGRTISFNSMVLRRQYRQLREELAKLPTPLGLEDMDIPFNSNISSSLTNNINIYANTDANTTISLPQTSPDSIDDASMQSANFDSTLSVEQNDTSNMQIDIIDPLALSLNEFL